MNFAASRADNKFQNVFCMRLRATAYPVTMAASNTVRAVQPHATALRSPIHSGRASNAVPCTISRQLVVGMAASSVGVPVSVLFASTRLDAGPSAVTAEEVPFDSDEEDDDTDDDNDDDDEDDGEGDDEDDDDMDMHSGRRLRRRAAGLA